MKILTKEEEDAHYNATLKGGSLGGAIGLAAGLAGVTLGSMRFPIIRHLTLPMKAFLVTSAGTFAAITSADSASRNFEKSKHPEEEYKDEAAKQAAERRAQQSSTDRLTEWAREHRYYIVGGSWVASMGLALGIVSRSPMSTAQKLVQARVYAQGLTLAVLVATAAFEISDQRNEKGRYEMVTTFDPKDPSHKKTIEKRVHKEEYQGEDQWKDMIAAEEEKIQRRNKEVKEYESEHHMTPQQKKGKKEHKNGDHKEDHKDESKNSSKETNGDDKKSEKKADKSGEKKDKK